MNTLQKKVETHLTNLIKNKDEELIDLVCDLGYEYENESLDSLMRTWTDRQKEFVTHIVRVGSHEEFSIFWIQLNHNKLLRTVQRTVINLINRQFPYNMIIFSNIDNSIWDFINIKAVKDQASEEDREPKKRQFLRRIKIDQQERLRTAIERISLLEIPEEGIHHFDLQKQHDEAFDVEKVTDDFFDEFKTVFTVFKKYLIENTEDEKWSHDYILQFFNRLIFIYFIQKKGWLGNDPEFIKSYWDAYKQSNQPENTFISKWLSVLFFDAFNKQAFYYKDWLPEKIDRILQEAPYLNGGLFKEIKDLDDKYDIQIKDDIFNLIFNFFQKYNFTISEDSPIDQEVAVDPEMIGKIFETMTFVEGDVDEAHAHGIIYTPRTEITLMCRLALVDRLINEFGEEHRNKFYELLFALTEEDKASADEQISSINLWPELYTFLRNITIIDPAVGSGSFLVGMLNILTDLIKRANDQLGYHVTDYNIKKGIINNSLYGVDIMKWAVHVCELRLWLQLIVETEMKPEERTIEPLLPNLNLKIRVGDSLVQQIGGVNFSHFKLIELPKSLKGKLTQLKGEKRKFFYNEPERKYKSEKAIEQEELRLFREILDFQIQNRKDRLKKIKQIISGSGTQKGFFEKGEQSSNLEEGFAKEINKIKNELRQYTEARNALKDRIDIPFIWDISFAEIFGENKHGFDIVIGNPPYVGKEWIADPFKDAKDYGGEKSAKWKQEKKIYKDKLKKSVYISFPKFFQYNSLSGSVKRNLNGQNDLYVYFYFHGLKLLNSKGSFCFVTSNSWLDAGYGKDLQEFLIKKALIKMILDNQKKRTFRRADVNTIICLFGNTSLKSKINNHVNELTNNILAKFVMFYIPFEQALNANIYKKINKISERTTTTEYRVVPKSFTELLENGLDLEKKHCIDSYIGDKWGGKYLRAPDIFFKIYKILKQKGSSLKDYCDFLGYIHDNNIGNRFPETDIIFSSQLIKKINISKNDGAIKIGVKETGNSKIIPDIVVPRTYNDTFLVYKNIDGILFKRFYKIILKDKKQIEIITMLLNSTIQVLFWEYIGIHAGLGALNVYKDDFSKIIIPEIDENDICKEKRIVIKNLFNRHIKNIYFECGFKQNKPIRSQKPIPPSDRKALDDIIFDNLALSEDERKEVYWSVCELVQKRLEKARSV